MPVASSDGPVSSREGTIGSRPETGSEPRIPTRGSGTRPAVRAVEVVRVVFGEPPDEPAVVSIVSRSHDDVLEYTHAFVVAYAKRRFLSRTVEPLSVATYELLGNALSYGSVSSQVLLQVHDSTAGVAVRVSNDTVQTRIEMLCAQLDRLSKNAESTFVEEMRRSVAGGLGRPALGLARVVHEAKLALEVYFAGQRVTVIARTH